MPQAAVLRPDSTDREIRAILNAVLLRREPIVLGVRNDGANLHIRFRAALNTPWVQFHVQTDTSGEGGSSYDPDNYKSTTLVDCRSNRLQDVSTGDIPPDRHYIWLIPVQEDGEDNKILFDGEGVNPDNMVFVDDRPPNVQASVTRQTTTYTVLASDYVIFGNTDGGAWTATLPAGTAGETHRIVNTGSSGNDLTIAPSGTEHLIGANSNFVLTDGEVLEITYDTTDGWY